MTPTSRRIGNPVTRILESRYHREEWCQGRGRPQLTEGLETSPRDTRVLPQGRTPPPTMTTTTTQGGVGNSVKRESPHHWVGAPPQRSQPQRRLGKPRRAIEQSWVALLHSFLFFLVFFFVSFLFKLSSMYLGTNPRRSSPSLGSIYILYVWCSLWHNKCYLR